MGEVGVRGPQHVASEKAPVGDRVGRIRRDRTARLERLPQPRDVDRPRQLPPLQLTPPGWPQQSPPRLSVSAPDFVEVLDFWFGAPDSSERGRPRTSWFRKSEPFDAEIRRRFLATWERAARGELGLWQATPLASLALIVVLDQFPRNMFRGTARAFSSDSPALSMARSMIALEFDRLLSLEERGFAYLPFEHAEDLAAQRRSLALSQALDPEDIGYARRHYEIIARFGRFPHRNAMLGRESTPEEIEFLKRPGSSF